MMMKKQLHLLHLLIYNINILKEGQKINLFTHKRSKIVYNFSLGTVLND